MRAQASRPLQFVGVDNQRTWFHRDLIDKLNDEADLLLLGGGGFIFHRPEDNSHSGWQFNVRIEDVPRIKVPIVVYAIGYNKFPFDDGGFLDVLNDHLKIVHEKSALFSVRNSGTRDELERRGLDAGKIEIVPDPAMFTPMRSPSLPMLRKDEVAIGLNWAGDRPGFRWGDEAGTRQKRAIETIAKSLHRVLKQRRGKVVLLPHIVDIDEEALPVLREILGDNVLNLRDIYPGMYPPATVQAPFLAGAYKKMDVVLGMRGHANIIPFGVGTPCIAVGHHPKNRYFLNEVGRPDLVLNQDSETKGFDVDKVAAMVTDVLDNGGLLSLLRRRLAELDAVGRDFDKRLLSLIGA